VVCTKGNGTNSVACRGTCYRTLYITDGGGRWVHSEPLLLHPQEGDFSFITLKRSDRLSRTTDGNLNDMVAVKHTRHFLATVYAPATARAHHLPPPTSPTGCPKQVKVGVPNGGAAAKP